MNAAPFIAFALLGLVCFCAAVRQWWRNRQ